ncbi:hypothetical protein [Mycobacterium marinum]|uniref:hypothetical protein n=1 Tax=Mycobacterium marinum TaxID=1781 RepID=UPI000B9688D7|nr:hypothetical protein [Mycobacterium marinum]MDC8982241.1 hypothetical protein [Mycobacterium marinum]MDC8994933.1 hypothetical protein [Mycobacterium marinum]MDC8998963.1 hypothetical protein [Mycobacterium marinum]MDC9009530.1 hypothetical protein [Mycobacterium marinum]MDC9015600.1 hypothetical protein [Mycobacterium marinum]
MSKPKMLAIGAEVALIAITLWYLVLRDFRIALAGIGFALATVSLIGHASYAARRMPAVARMVGVGTVRTVEGGEVERGGGERQIWIEVASVHGDTFIGRLVQDDAETETATLRPGLVVLVAFDPADRQQLSLPDDVLAVRARGLAIG